MKLHLVQSSLRSGRPTQIDMETWREMICSKSYGTHSQKLANEITALDIGLATNTVPHDHISTLLTCRLVPLKKNYNGIRPGVGECLCRIIGKTIKKIVKGKHHPCNGNTTDMLDWNQA